MHLNVNRKSDDDDNMLIESEVSLNLCVGFIGIDRVISELCYKRTILQQNHRKMTMKDR